MAGKPREFRDLSGTGNIFRFVLEEAARVRATRAAEIARRRSDVVSARRAEYGAARRDDALLPAKV